MVSWRPAGTSFCREQSSSRAACISPEWGKETPLVFSIIKCLYRRKVQMNVDTIAEDDLLSLYSTKLHGSRDRRFTFYIYTHLLSTKHSTENEGRQQERNCWCAQRTCHGPLAREPTALMKRDRTTNMQCRCWKKLKDSNFELITTSLELKHWNIQFLSYHPYIIWMKGSKDARFPIFQLDCEHFSECRA